jgi:hypothetical protein
MRSSITRALGVFVAIGALVLTPFSGAIAGQKLAATAGIPAIVATDSYPSWDDVNAAKANEAQKQAEVDNIKNLLSNLSAEAARLSNIALQRGEEYLVATYNLDAATQTADSLQKRATDAVTTATNLKSQVGAFAAQLYRNGGDTSTASLLVQGEDASSLLYRLGAMSKLTEQSGDLLDRAKAAANNAEALQNQANVAVDERNKLETAAQDSLNSAQSAKSAADAQLAEQTKRSTVLYDQLASLNNTTAQVEKDYAAGVQALADQKAREAEADASAGGGGGSSWVPDSGSIASPDEAKNIAYGMLGSYGWGGDQYSCLVQLWTGESGWRVNAYNPDSGAYGIPQSWPASKMSSVADDWATNAYTQIIWGLNYIDAAYGSPCNAWAKWQARSPHWY